MTTYFDFATRPTTHNKSDKLIFDDKSYNVENYTMLVLFVLKLVFGIVFIMSAVVGFFNMYKLVNLYHARHKKLVEYYAMLVAKKNELDYVTSPAFREERLRNIYGAYKPGEKLVIFTGQINIGNTSYKDREVNAREIWVNLLLRGITSLYR